MDCNPESSYDIVLSPDLQLSFTVMMKLSGLPFHWKFDAAPVSAEMVISLVLSVWEYILFG